MTKTQHKVYSEDGELLAVLEITVDEKTIEVTLNASQPGHAVAYKPLAYMLGFNSFIYPLDRWNAAKKERTAKNDTEL